MNKDEYNMRKDIHKLLKDAEQRISTFCTGGADCLSKRCSTCELADVSNHIKKIRMSILEEDEKPCCSKCGRVLKENKTT